MHDIIKAFLIYFILIFTDIIFTWINLILCKYYRKSWFINQFLLVLVLILLCHSALWALFVYLNNYWRTVLVKKKGGLWYIANKMGFRVGKPSLKSKSQRTFAKKSHLNTVLHSFPKGRTQLRMFIGP